MLGVYMTGKPCKSRAHAPLSHILVRGGIDGVDTPRNRRRRDVGGWRERILGRRVDAFLVTSLPYSVGRRVGVLGRRVGVLVTSLPYSLGFSLQRLRASL